MPPLGVRLSVQLCHCFNLDYDGAAWPSQETLATKLGVRREAINRTIGIMVAFGHLNRPGADATSQMSIAWSSRARANPRGKT